MNIKTRLFYDKKKVWL